MHLGGEARQEERLFECGVAATDHRHLFALEEEAVASGTRANAASAQSRLGFKAEPDRRCARCNYHRIGGELATCAPGAEGSRGEVNAFNILVDDHRAEPLRLRDHLRHQLWSVDPLRESWEVLNFTGEHQLSARLVACEQRWLQLRACRIDGGGESSGA